MTTAPSSNLPPMMTHGRRGRPSDYTAEEDVIILRHRNTDDVQRLLREAGLPERTPAAIWSRRKLLHEGGMSDEVATMLNAHESLPSLIRQREKALERLSGLEEEVEFVRTDIERMTAEMHRLIDAATEA